ncbi:MAG: lamin tail domain-containing protein [Bacteroidales bacterium]|nr:lamin tail domain-containing protein [Bacteroidales bacterium]
MKSSVLSLFFVILISLTTPVAYGQKPQAGDVLVSEILFNPEPGGSDYVELYNATERDLELKDIFLAKLVDNTIKRLYVVCDSGILHSHQWVVVTGDEVYVRNHYNVRYPERLKEMASMPSYNDASGSVVVCNGDTVVIDRFDYDESMHSSMLRSREGVALERRSYNAPTQDASNWYSAASTAGFGTPTYANSQSHEMIFVDDDFAVGDGLFSPDGDGYNDLLDITYNLLQCDLNANIMILDSRGHKVRNIGRGVSLGCQGVLTWDGTDDRGNKMPRGRYVVYIEAYNATGVSQTCRRSVALVRE